MKEKWFKIVWDVVRFSLLMVISIIILNNAPQLMNESSWFYYWLGFVLQIGGFILLGYSVYDGIKSIVKYSKEVIKG